MVSSYLQRMYYRVRPLVPRSFQLAVRRCQARRILKRASTQWPIDPTIGMQPSGWPGWPDGKRFALILTHDIESSRGLENCYHLAEMERNIGFRSSFNFLALKYDVSPDLRSWLVSQGFEVGCHGLYHDGRKFASYKIFKKRAELINAHLDQWGAVGFRSPSMQCNLDWIGELNIEYDMSTYDTDPFEPWSCPIRSIFPILIPAGENQRSYIEMPYTLAQDFTLFILLKERDIGNWLKKIEWIAGQGGMALINTHPDYMSFSGDVKKETYSYEFYREFLIRVKEKYDGQFYHCLPKELAAYSRRVLTD